MSVPRYPAYKDSGIKWLGEVPEHWEMCRTKYLFELMKRPPREGDGIVTAFRDGMVTLRANRREDGFTNSIQEIGYQGVRCGDLVIHAMDGFAGAIGVSDSDGKCTPVYAVCEPKESVSAKYFSTILRHAALSGFVSSLSKGIRERSTEFRWNEAGNLSLPLPPPSEQSAIAAFLDRETGKIDALVAEQEKLIGLLKEKRQAVISHAVTKGLDPSVRMKDSGIPWLGKVPGHWEIVPLKRLLIEPLMYGANEAADDDTPENPRFVRITDIDETGNLRDETFRSLPFDVAKSYLLRSGDILLARSGATVGKSFIYRNSWGTCCFAGYLIRARGNLNLVSADYLYKCCQSNFYWHHIRSEQIQSTIQNVSAERYASLILPLPPRTEQSAIAAFLDEQTAKFDTLIAEAQRAIELLKEHRSALISAAVTGKIDVRNCVALQEVA